MSDRDQELNDALKALAQVYIAKLPAKLEEIRIATNRFKDHPDDRENFSLLHRLLHTMAGSAGTFGFPEMGEASRDLEKQLKEFISGANWSKTRTDQFCEQVLAYVQSSMPVSDALVDGEVKEQSSPITTLGDSEPRGKGLILWADHEFEKNKEIVQLLEQFAFDIQHVEKLSQLESLIEQYQPSLLIVDMDFQHGQFAGTEEVMRLRGLGKSLPPILFTSNINSFECRLRSVRAGGDAFFLKPIDLLAVTEAIEKILDRPNPPLYRILIIDDDVDLAQYYSRVLKGAGMIAEVLNHPELVLETMANFRPELILMDVYMPDCDGVELSRVIRQDPSYLDVPIVFLSSENNLQKQIAAVKVGADDFLNKPISPELLTSSLATRAERYRALRTLVMRDGLTGLYNHTAIKEDLIAKMSSASRSVTCVAVAMLDLDDFKKVNDTYGHQIGDQVLRTLSHLLRQRLRKSDVVGRYGGEEFIVIFPNTTADVARMVLDKIRMMFATIHHMAEQGEFCVGFSAGIADSRQSTNPDDLLTIADAALYRAKHSGKNQIILGDQ
ncbi:diguanylate cyclase [Undibacterium fentianense]|uniref:diguanylate cyclase n=1 Tax=Undibacterium fentianense TaxID=2828728 RepID=A0A941E7Q8_9BURK|nr:diguanylate cyclase [Undibacterium fentianense]MBR7801283.1 diguanylate cyclase [Undibacterium fentianense]